VRCIADMQTKSFSKICSVKPAPEITQTTVHAYQQGARTRTAARNDEWAGTARFSKPGRRLIVDNGSDGAPTV
jgi:hypothetical protein